MVHNDEILQSSDGDTVALYDTTDVKVFMYAILFVVSSAVLYLLLWPVLLVTARVLYHTLVASAKGLVPCGLWPRKSVRDEIVLVTGAGSGMGRLVAIRVLAALPTPWNLLQKWLQFAKLGAQLVLWDVNEDANLATKDEIVTAGGKTHAYTIDLSRREDVYALSDRVRADVGDVDVLVNCAGMVHGKRFLESSDALIEKTMAVNALALCWTAKAFLPKMVERDHGHLVTIASMSGYSGSAGLVDYCASKHAAVGFQDALRSELRAMRKSIPVTTINPSYVNTGMFAGVKSNSPLMYPLLAPEFVADRIIEAVLTDTEAIYLPPATSSYLMLKGILPQKALAVVEDFFGVHEAMDAFVGRERK